MKNTKKATCYKVVCQNGQTRPERFASLEAAETAVLNLITATHWLWWAEEAEG